MICGIKCIVLYRCSFCCVFALSVRLALALNVSFFLPFVFLSLQKCFFPFFMFCSSSQFWVMRHNFCNYCTFKPAGKVNKRHGTLGKVAGNIFQQVLMLQLQLCIRITARARAGVARLRYAVPRREHFPVPSYNLLDGSLTVAGRRERRSHSQECGV